MSQFCSLLFVQLTVLFLKHSLCFLIHLLLLFSVIYGGALVLLNIEICHFMLRWLEIFLSNEMWLKGNDLPSWFVPCVILHQSLINFQSSKLNRIDNSVFRLCCFKITRLSSNSGISIEFVKTLSSFIANFMVSRLLLIFSRKPFHSIFINQIVEDLLFN